METTLRATAKCTGNLWLHFLQNNTFLSLCKCRGKQLARLVLYHTVTAPLLFLKEQ